MWDIIRKNGDIKVKKDVRHADMVEILRSGEVLTYVQVSNKPGLR